MLPWHTRWAAAGSRPRGSTAVGGSEVSCSAVLPTRQRGTSLFCFMTRGLTPNLLSLQLRSSWFLKVISQKLYKYFKICSYHLACIFFFQILTSVIILIQYHTVIFFSFFFLCLCPRQTTLLLQVSNPPGLVRSVLKCCFSPLKIQTKKHHGGYPVPLWDGELSISAL